MLSPLRRMRSGPQLSTAGVNLVILCANAFSGLITARSLGPSGRGQLALVTTWMAIVQLLGTAGLPSACTYFVSRRRETRVAFAKWFSRAARWQLLVLLLPSALALWLLNANRGVPLNVVIASLMWPSAGAASLMAVAYLQGCEDFTKFNILRLVAGALPACVLAIELFTVRLSVVAAVAAYAGSVACAAGLGLWWMARIPTAPKILASEHRRELWSYARRSLFSLSGLSLNSSADQMILGLIATPTVLGVYSVAASTSAPLVVAVAALGMAGLPQVARLENFQKVAATWAMVRRSILVAGVLGPIAAMAIPVILPVVYGKGYSEAIGPAEILLVGGVFAGICTVADDLLRAYGKPGSVGTTQLLGGIVTGVGTFLFGGTALLWVSVASTAGYAAATSLSMLRLKYLILAEKESGSLSTPRDG